MTAKTNTNGQIRKTLADQIDRLDSMLDGLAEGLNDAVAAAVKDAVGPAVQQAVQAVLREALANPELLARLGAVVAPAPATPTQATPAAATVTKTTWKQRWIWVRQKVTTWVTAVRMECGRRLGQAGRCVTCVWNRLLVLGRFPYSLLTAAAVAVAAGVAACFAQPWLAAAVGYLTAFAAMLAVRVRTAWGRLTRPAVEPNG
jgi:hypothetical protein